MTPPKPKVTGRRILTWDYRHLPELTAAFNSDEHLGHNACDEKAVCERYKMLEKRNIPTAHLGDLIENATRDSVGAGVYEQEEIADEQIERAIDILKPLASKGLLLSMQPGNHEMRTHNASGVNLTRIMAKFLSVPYAGAGLVHYILVGDQKYVGYSTHGGSGAATVGGKINSLLKLESIVDADFYIQGHTHDTIHHARVYHALDCRSKSLVERKRHFINNGAWLNYWDTYGQVKGYSPPNKGNAIIKFDGTKHRLQVKFE